MLAKDMLGKFGEDLAARHLVGAGFEIITRNWRCDVGEIDIVARDGSTLVLVEVKTRSSTAYGTPAEAITPRKADKLRQLAMAWFQANPGGRGAVRIDVIGVVAPKNAPVQLEHLRGVVL